MGATTTRSGFALVLCAVLLAGLTVVSAVAVGADDDDAELKKAFKDAGLEWFDSAGDGAADDATEPAIGVDALSGLSAGAGGGDTSDPAGTGDLNDPLAGGAGGSSDDADADKASGSGPGTTEGSDPTDPRAYRANPMFKLMADLILSEVKAAEAEAQKEGKALTEAEKAAVATGAARELITFLQQTNQLLGEGASGDAQANELLKQIMGIPTEPQVPSSKPSKSSDTDDTDDD